MNANMCNVLIVKSNFIIIMQPNSRNTIRNSLLQSKYCDHFNSLKISRSFSVQKEPTCYLCAQQYLPPSSNKNIWLCLAKNCEAYCCQKNQAQHMKTHLEQSKLKKSFHSSFINVKTAEIRCVSCNIEIMDFDTPNNDVLNAKLESKAQPNNYKIKSKSKSQIRPKQSQQLQDPYPLRLRLIPALDQLTKYKLLGQLENPEGHRKYSKGLIGIFGTKFNHIINAVVQFFSHCEYLKCLILETRFQNSSEILLRLKQLLGIMQSAKFRAIRADKFAQALYRKKPQLLSYARKDPFDYIMIILNDLHQQLKFFTSNVQFNSKKIRNQTFCTKYRDKTYMERSSSPQKTVACSIFSLPFKQPLQEEKDEWECLSKMRQIYLKSPVFDCLNITLSLNYQCEKCKSRYSSFNKMDFLKLNFPRKRKRVKDIQKDFQEHRILSPVKHRRKSLINLILPTQSQCPITIPELIMDFLRQSYCHRQKLCEKCGLQMKKTKNHFLQLPSVLIILINRMNNDGASIDQTPLIPQTQVLNLACFTSNQQAQSQYLYQFESAICYQKGCLFPVMTRNQLNKQLYQIRNQSVQMIKQPLNPYILCYRKRVTRGQEDTFHNIESSIICQGIRIKKQADLSLSQGPIDSKQKEETFIKNNSGQIKQQNNLLILPDHWLTQLHFNHQMPVQSQLKCKHGNRKPLIKSKMEVKQYIPFEIYEALTQKYGGSLFKNIVCQQCTLQLQNLNLRKQHQKQVVVGFDKMKSNTNCMVSSKWIEKWKNFLYKKPQNGYGYLFKGYPMPGAIQNKQLLQNGKCKKNLKGGQDYVVINLFVWKFLKELYGGGPQIRYKSSSSSSSQIQQQILRDVKKRAQQICQIYTIHYDFISSPSKKGSTIIEKTTSFVESQNGQDDLPSP